MRKALALTLLLVYATSAGAEIFTWTDHGTRHFTNSIHEVPARYRSKVKVLDVPTGKKLAPTPAQLAGQTQTQPSDQAAGGPVGAASAQPATPPAPAAPVPAAQNVAPRQPAAGTAPPVQQPVRATRRLHRPRGGSREE